MPRLTQCSAPPECKKRIIQLRKNELTRQQKANRKRDHEKSQANPEIFGISQVSKHASTLLAPQSYCHLYNSYCVPNERTSWR
jgi:hypothetical protein